MTIRSRSTPNIAFIKYWGNRNDELRLPAADSLSMTLDSPSVDVTVTDAEDFSVRSFEPDGREIILSEKSNKRIEKQFTLARQFLPEKLPLSVRVEIRSLIPRAVGFASSAAVSSALAEAYGGFIPNISRRDVSIIARLGSGSASRSIFGGFSAMIRGSGSGIDASYAEQIAPPKHWSLWDVVIVPSLQEKETGSTEGHALAHTSRLFKKRLSEIPARQKRCIQAIRNKDFSMLQQVAEEDCLDMFAVMHSSTPPLEYLIEETYRIVDDIKRVRQASALPVLFTMDAGPSVHLVCEERALENVRMFAEQQKDCRIFEAKIGGGSTLQ